jgi:hypothetical protein
MKHTAYTKKELNDYAAKCLIYVREGTDGYIRPSAFRFHRDGRVSAYLFGWVDVTGRAAWTTHYNWTL